MVGPVLRRRRKTWRRWTRPSAYTCSCSATGRTCSKGYPALGRSAAGLRFANGFANTSSRIAERQGTKSLCLSTDSAQDDLSGRAISA